MGLLLVAEGDSRRIVPLATTCLAGRGTASLVRIEHPACPSHWIELRWHGGGWAWRALNAVDRTRGSGSFLVSGWRTMEVNADRGTRISLGSQVWLELVDSGPPEPFAWDMLAAAPITDETLETVAERRGDALLPLSAEGDAKAALRDGQFWMVPGPEGPRMLRAHVPVSMVATLSARLDLALGGVSVAVHMESETAVFEQGDVKVSVRGVCVRTLNLYARERTRGMPWLTAADAWAAWTDLGGAESSPKEVVAWERARLRQLLDRARVGSVDALFLTRKESGYVRVRLGDAITHVDILP